MFLLDQISKETDMFGPNLKVSTEGIEILMRPFTKEDLPVVTAGFSRPSVTKFTLQIFGATLEAETDWYEKIRASEEDAVWAIVPQGQEEPVGVTGLHKIECISGTCTSGIVIWEPKWWGKGMATAAHLGRTLFAVDQLNRNVIRSEALCANKASVKALHRVGYHTVGVEPRTLFRRGRYWDSYYLCWINPEKIGLLFPEGLPDKYSEGVERAKIALERARQVVEYV